MLAFNQGRADAVMYDDAVLLPVAAADRTAKITDDTFLEAPFGIGIKQGNTALKAWVDSRLALMKKKDQFLPILKANVPPRFVHAFSKNILRPNNTFRYAAPGRLRARTPFARRSARRRRPGGGRGAPPLSRDAADAARAYDLWAFVSENRDELSTGFVNTLKVSAIAIVGAFAIGIVLGAARAHRIPVVSQFTAVYVEVIRNTPILVQIFLLFYGLPQFGIRLDQFTVAWLSVMIWGGAFNSENFRAGFLAVSHRHREAAYALGFGRSRTFLNVTLPIGGRIALPSSINTYISVVKNTSLMYVIGYTELTTTAINISNLTLQTTGGAHVLGDRLPRPSSGSLSAADPPARGAGSRLAGGGSVHVLDARLGRAGRRGTSSQEGLPGTLRVAAIAVVGSTLIGVVLGTLLTIHFRPSQALIRLYIEVFRGLPILVTVFIVFFGLPSISPQLEFAPLTATSIALIALGQRAGRRGDARRGPVDPARAARGGVGARLRLGRQPRAT